MWTKHLFALLIWFWWGCFDPTWEQVCRSTILSPGNKILVCINLIHIWSRFFQPLETGASYHRDKVSIFLFLAIFFLHFNNIFCFVSFVDVFGLFGGIIFRCLLHSDNIFFCLLIYRRELAHHCLQQISLGGLQNDTHAWILTGNIVIIRGKFFIVLFI